MNANQSLSDFAEALDRAKLSSMADHVDKISSNVLAIKTAQYVGVQGYWIRNKRCWENCYRQKRAQNKSMPAQKVWTDCHSEYVKSINNDNADWNKYAEEVSMQKFASVKNHKVILANEKKYFNNKLAERISGKWPIGNAVFDSVESGLSRREDSLLKEINKVAKIASKLKKAGQKRLAYQAEYAFEDMIKEAQFLNNM